MIMTFGKYKGKRLEDVPESYLRWALENCRNLAPSQQREIAHLLKIQDREFYPPVSIEQYIEPWYRRLALEFHPDKRGSHLAMVAINRARELLLEMAGGAI